MRYRYMAVLLAMASAADAQTTRLTDSIQFVGRSLASPSQWVTPEDYPAGIASVPIGSTVVEVAVNLRGRVETCKIKTSSGAAQLDEIGCKLLPERARFAEIGVKHTRSVTIPWANVRALAPAVEGKPVPVTMIKASVPVESPTTWFRDDNSFKSAFQTLVSFRLIVNDQGKVVGCSAESRDSKEPNVESLACKLMRQNARFRPAMDRQGGTMFGVYEGQFSWQRVLTTPLQTQLLAGPDKPDMVFAIQTLPAGWSGPINLTAHVLIGTDGKPKDCAVRSVTTSGPDPRPNPQRVSLISLGETVCNEVRSSWTAVIAHDGEGKAVPAVHEISIRIAPRGG